VTDTNILQQAADMFEYYQKVFSAALGQQLKYILTAGLKDTIAGHIQQRGYKFVQRAVDNFARSDFHLGRGARSDGTVYCEPSRVFSDKNIDKFGNMVINRADPTGAGNPTSQYALPCKASIARLIARRDQYPRYGPLTPLPSPEAVAAMPDWLQKRYHAYEAAGKFENMQPSEEYHWVNLNNSVFGVRARLAEYLETGVEPRYASEHWIKELRAMTEDEDANDACFIT